MTAETVTGTPAPWGEVRVILAGDPRTEAAGAGELTVPPGLIGWTGGTSRDRARFASLLREALRPWDASSPEEATLAWDGGGLVEPDEIWRAGARLLADRAGARALDRVVARLGGLPEGDGDRVEELREVEARLEAMGDVPGELRTLEARLRRLRADAAEAVGDLEVATMEWLRERQDAETQLQTYRDQARELKARMDGIRKAGPESPCPFCGRPLEGHLDEVAAELDEEWERLVQDGSWWRKRREQLELKPERLQELEAKALRLQAEVQECSERVERCRFDLREWDELRGRRQELRPDTAGGEDLPGAAAERRPVLLRAFEEARDSLVAEWEGRLALRAGVLLNRISGGRILGLTPGTDGPVPVEDGRPVPDPPQEDRAAAALSLHLALVLELLADGAGQEAVLIAEPFPLLEPHARQRTVEMLRDLRDVIPRFVLLSGEGVEAMPERFDWILDFRADRSPLPLKLARGGVGRLRLVDRGS